MRRICWKCLVCLARYECDDVSIDWIMLDRYDSCARWISSRTARMCYVHSIFERTGIASAACINTVRCSRDFERHRWAMNQRYGVYSHCSAGVPTVEVQSTPSCNSPISTLSQRAQRRIAVSFLRWQRTWCSGASGTTRRKAVRIYLRPRETSTFDLLIPCVACSGFRRRRSCLKVRFYWK